MNQLNGTVADNFINHRAKLLCILTMVCLRHTYFRHKTIFLNQILYHIPLPAFTDRIIE